MEERNIRESNGVEGDIKHLVTPITGVGHGPKCQCCNKLADTHLSSAALCAQNKMLVEALIRVKSILDENEDNATLGEKRAAAECVSALAGKWWS